MTKGLRYANGQKRCTDCEVFITWDGIFCPCCNHQLKVKPRSSKDKRRLEEEIVVKRH